MTEQNINEIIYRCFVMDEDAFPELLQITHAIAVNEYKRRMCKELVPKHELAEFLSSADLILLDCLQCYRIDQKTSFLSYYKRALWNYLTDLSREKKTVAGYEEDLMISLDCRIGENGDSYLHEIVEDEKADRFAESIKWKESLDAMAKSTALNATEQEIMALLLQGYSKKEVSQQTGKCYKTIRRACTKFDQLLKRHLTDNQK